ncbi:glycosyltransferase family 1 protein [Sphingomonas sp. OK281]|uniref:glycosyltransferase family 4 protein n=1 Tax=Sphingomonas sp. OK281 TaxID=1881067 RepID=UPI0008EF9B3B|nr:glycosyltransferase family 1 protein [Sphingomonas sp. OK281]SFO11114.1 Glycosyltransferase involved in cell wall bisynthesis [Sphingomonas sp. OK281]
MLFKLALNGRFLGRPVTGVERLAIELADAIDNRVVEVGGDTLPSGSAFEILAPSPDLAAITAAASIRFPRNPVQAIGRLNGHAWEQRELSQARPDAWLLNLCNTAPILRRRQAVVICDAQFILHPESYSRAFRWWYRFALSIASRRAAALFTISEFSKEQLEQFGVFPKNKAQVLRLGIDHLDKVAADDEVVVRHGLVRPYVLAIGSLARHKNLRMLVDAFCDERPDGIDLVIAGGGNARVFGDAGLRKGENIRYLGRVNDGELKALYAHAMAFACPSLSEGFGLTPLEAMRLGCPVIATTGGAVPEICGDAVLYADPADQSAWRAALAKIVSDAGLRQSLRDQGLERAASYTWRGAAIQMLEVISELDAAGQG